MIIVCTEEQWLDYCKHYNHDPKVLIYQGMEVKFVKGLE